MKAIFPLVLIALALGPGPAVANPTVYHSSECVDSGGPKRLLPALTQDIDLYACVRNAEGTAYEDVYGIDVTVEVAGGGKFTKFATDGDVVYWPQQVSDESPTSSLRLNVVQRIGTPLAGPQLLGTLTLATGTTGSEVTAKGQVVVRDPALLPEEDEGVLKAIPLRIIASSSVVECNDGLDNDGDTVSDTRDSDCSDQDDPLEAPDQDEDGIGDDEDNCVEVANGPLIPDAGGNVQLDSDHDGYGNACDGDFTQSLPIIGFPDLAQMRQAIGKHRDSNECPDDDGISLGPCAEFDLDGNLPIIGFPDLARFRAMMGKPPGPSGLACAGSVPCP